MLSRHAHHRCRGSFLARNFHAGCLRFAGRSRNAVLLGAVERDYKVALDPTVSRSAREFQGNNLHMPVIASAVAIFAAAYWFKIKSEEDRHSSLPEPWPEIPDEGKDPKAYAAALARTRQAMHVQKAVGFMHAGEPARANLELLRALQENEICRSPLLRGHQTKEELAALFSLWISANEMPPKFASLLQLRLVLGISAEESDRLEQAALQADSAFSI